MTKNKDKSSLLVNGITEDQKGFLYNYAKDQLGSRSRTKAILNIIDKEMGKPSPTKRIELPKMPKVMVNPYRKKVELSLRFKDYLMLDKIVEETDSSIQYYIISLILENLYDYQRLDGEQIELLRKSNYQLHKIGVNINQIAKAINEGDKRSLDIEKLDSYIKDHVEAVKILLAQSQKKI